MQKAQLVDVLCQRWHCPPRQVLQEDAHEVFVMLAVLAGEAGPEEDAAMPAAAPTPPLGPLMAELAALSTALGD